MVVEESAVLVGKEEELGESGGCEERFHSKRKNGLVQTASAMLVADNSYLLSASLHFLDFSLQCVFLSYSGQSFSLLYSLKSYRGIAQSIVVSLEAIGIAFKRIRMKGPNLIQTESIAPLGLLAYSA